MAVTSEALREAIRRRVLPERPAEDARAIARVLARLGGGSIRAVVFFGSRKTRAKPDPWSAYDFFVLTSDYRGFYRALVDAGALHRGPMLASALNAVLPPNQISLTVRDDAGTSRRAKCAVISLAGFLQETSAQRRDHFCLGRLFQPVEVVFAADDEAREAVLRGVVGACALTFTWVRPWLPARFDVASYTRALLRVSLAREIRPEPQGRADALWEAQKEDLVAVYGIYLEELAAAGELRTEREGLYAPARPVTWAERLRVEAYFRWSLLRATARWFKYVVTFEGWLDYILRKAQRHSGQEIVLTSRERRLPLVFLWPRLIRYLRQKDQGSRG